MGHPHVLCWTSRERSGKLIGTQHVRQNPKLELYQRRARLKLRRPAMPLHHLQHFLIQTEDLEKTRDWYVDVLGMRVGPHPDFKFPVYWLYLGDTDVLHLTQGG